MKLYVSSIGIPNPESFSRLLPNGLAGVKVAIISNGLEPGLVDDPLQKVEGYKADLATVGLDGVCHDLLDYKSPFDMKEDLARQDVLYMPGSNTEALQRAMQFTGFHRMIRNLLADGVIYAGESASAIAVSSRGLGIVPAAIIPRADDPQFSAEAKLVQEQYRRQQKPVIVLKNNQDLVVSS